MKHNTGKKSDNKIKKRRLDNSKHGGFHASRVKSYYGFMKEYPGTVDENGYRDIKKQGSVSELKRKTKSLMIKSFISVFIISFTVCYICLCISNHPVDSASVTGEDVHIADSEKTGRGYYVPGQTLYNQGVDKIISDLKSAGVKSVLLDAKDGAGYIYYKCDDAVSVTASAIQYCESDFGDCIRRFSENGIKTSVLFSCFADTFEASYISDMAVYEKNTGNLWYDNSLSPHAWLDPFNDGTQTYLMKQIDRLAEYGAGEIVLTNVCLPVCTNTDTADFGTNPADSVNGKMAEFVKSVIRKYGDKCDISAYTVFEDVNGNLNVKNHLIDVNVKRLFVDMRLSIQPDNIRIDTDVFEKPGKRPYMFISNALYASAGITGKSTGKSTVVPVIEYSASTPEQENAVKSHGVNDYYIYGYYGQ